MDWAKFSFNFNLDVEGLLRDVVSIEAYREAALNLVLPPNWREQLDKLNRVRAVHGTTALEGNPLSEAEVAKQIETLEEAGQEAVNRMSKEQLQIRNSGLGQEW